MPAPPSWRRESRRADFLPEFWQTTVSPHRTVVRRIYRNTNGLVVIVVRRMLLRQQRPLILSLLVVLAVLLLPGSSSAQAGYRYTAGFLGGFGGTTATQPSSTAVAKTFLAQDQFDLGLQLVFNTEMRRNVLFGVRVGQMDVEIDNVGTPLAILDPVESELTYATLAGEYRLSAGAYQSGLYFGIGYYGVDGQELFEDDTALGLNFGTTGDFRINDRWSVLVEISGHYADLEYAQFFIMGHVGVGFHF